MNTSDAIYMNLYTYISSYIHTCIYAPLILIHSPTFTSIHTACSAVVSLYTYISVILTHIQHTACSAVVSLYTYTSVILTHIQHTACSAVVSLYTYISVILTHIQHTACSAVVSLYTYISVILTHIQHTACSAVVGSITYHILFSVNELQPKIVSFLQPQVPVHFLQ